MLNGFCQKRPPSGQPHIMPDMGEAVGRSDMGGGASSAFAKNAPPRSDGELCSTEVWGHPRTAG